MVQSAPAEKRGASRSKAAIEKSRSELQSTLQAAADRLLRERGLRPGSIVFRDPADDAIFAMRLSQDRAEFARDADSTPLLEITGDPRRLRSIIEGRKDAREQFFAGGISVRGDMHFLSEVGLALGFLKTPIV
jgi:predicted lipid carrier protein YhbT